MALTVIDENRLAAMIYDTPVTQPGDSKITRIKKYFKRRNHFVTVIKPRIQKMRTTAPTFSEMCEFADFIRIIEKVYFYKNELPADSDPKMRKRTLACDNKYDDQTKKIIFLYLSEEKVTISFKMTRELKDIKNPLRGVSDVIEVKTMYRFGKGLEMGFYIIDGEVNDFKSVHDYNALISFQTRLQNSMADLFEEYYYYNIKSTY